MKCKLLSAAHVLAGLIVVTLLQAGCGEPKDRHATAASEAAPQQASLLTLQDDQLARLKISTVQADTWPVAVHTTGTVDWDADHTSSAITQVTGPISRILVDTGTVVKKGEPLLYVSSADVSNAISTYKKARNQQELARRITQRQQGLLDRGAIAAKDLEAAQATLNDTSTDVQSSLQTLKIFDITKEELDNAEKQGVPISPELAVRAPISGAIVQKLVSPGQLVQAGATICFVISDISTVWVQGHIFDRDLPSVHVGNTVEETNASFPTILHGVVAYVGALVDPATRTTPVRIVTHNPGGLLKKDAFVEAIIHTRTQKNILTVPVSSVLRNSENEPLVYVEEQPGKFAQRLITIGSQQNDRIEVLSGVKQGEKIVSEGSLFLQFANNYQ
ncbi:MAG: efflux RND transporter periplasmic adaptor subunit [Acidobacteriota bacterium]|nr:efflux RND transporter periplasmic adaptor subunit [Acidobacteriota bacterium]